MSEIKVVPNRDGDGDGVVLVSDGSLLRAHLIRRGLLRPHTSEVAPSGRIDMGPVLTIDGVKKFNWTDMLDHQHARKDSPT